MIRKTLLLIFFIFSITYGNEFELEEDLVPFEGRIIKSVTIVRKNVFDNHSDGELPFYYRWGNKLHIITRRSVIEGCCLRPASGSTLRKL
jgi:hypothetical protein